MNNVNPRELKPAAVLKRYEALVDLYGELKAKAANSEDPALREYAATLPDAENQNLQPSLTPLIIHIKETPIPQADQQGDEKLPEFNENQAKSR